MKKHAVSAIIHYHGKILIGKKRSDSPKFLAGKWHIPGETVKEKESDFEALIRGVGEELSLKISVERYLCSSISPTSKSEVRWYECFSNTDRIFPSSDLEDAKWIYKKEIKNYLDEETLKLWPKEIFDYFKI
ncbi:MAG: NUDIX hydrolase [archaeon]|nr:NUDIX hydrolase [archaeon]